MGTGLEFERIVAEHEARIVRYLANLLGDVATAQDLAQETFVRVHRSLEQLRSPDACTAWIYRIASNVALDHLRSRTTRQEGQTLPLEEELLAGSEGEQAASSEDPSAEGRLEQEETAACLRGYIHDLPELLRACLILRDLEGLGEDAVAEILDCSVGAVKVRTHRARRKLREWLREGCRVYHDKRGVLLCDYADAEEERP